MMPYCTSSELGIDNDRLREFVPLLDENEEPVINQETGKVEIDYDKIDAEIEIACGEVDGFLKKKYTVPLSTPPVIIKALAIAISRYRVYLHSQAIPEEEGIAYKRAIDTLKLYANGTLTLDPEVTESTVEVVDQYEEPVFSMEMF